MPSYLCHVCSAYNAFPSPTCNGCTHKYCIACLPVVPNPSPLRSSFTVLDGSEDIGSGFSSSRSSIIEEVRHIHPAYRCATPTEDMEEEEEEYDDEEYITGEEEAFNAATAFQHDSKEPSVHLAENPSANSENEKPTLMIQSPTPIHPTPPPPPTAILIPGSTSPPTLFLSPSTSDLPSPVLLPDWPPWETATTTTKKIPSHLLHPHSRGKSMEEHRYKLERELRRTMSMQSEKVSRLMRKGSMRLKEAAARASSVGRAK